MRVLFVNELVFQTLSWLWFSSCCNEKEAGRAESFIFFCSFFHCRQRAESFRLTRDVCLNNSNNLENHKLSDFKMDTTTSSFQVHAKGADDKPHSGEPHNGEPHREEPPKEYTLAYAQRLETKLAGQRTKLGSEHAQTLETMRLLGSAYYHLGRFRDAVAISEELVPISKRVWGEDHPGTLVAQNDLALYLHESGQFEEALRQHEAVLDTTNPG